MLSKARRTHFSNHAQLSAMARNMCKTLIGLASVMCAGVMLLGGMALCGRCEKAREERYINAIREAEKLDADYVFVDNDSAIAPAADYFEGRGGAEEVLSKYYLAITYENAGRVPEAILVAQDAERVALDRRNPYYYELGRISRLLERLYSAGSNLGQSVKYGEKAVCYFGSVADTDLQSRYCKNFAIVDLALSLVASQRYGQALCLLDSLCCHTPEADMDSLLRRETLKAKALAYFAAEKPDSALAAFDEADALGGYLDIREMAALATLEYMRGNTLLGDSLRREALAIAENVIDSSYVVDIDYRLALARQDYKTAIDAAIRLDSLQDKWIQSVLSHNLTNHLHSLALQQLNEAERNEELSESRNVGLGVAVALLCCVVVLIVLLYRKRLAIKQIEIDGYIKEIAALVARQAEEGHSAELPSSFDLLETLCRTYFTNHGTAKEKAKIYSDVIGIIDSYRDGSQVTSIAEALDSHCGGMMTAFREAFPEYAPEKYKFAVYAFSGMSAQALAIFMDKSLSNIYTMKSRLKKEIRQSDLRDKDIYLSKLGR